MKSGDRLSSRTAPSSCPMASSSARCSPVSPQTVRTKCCSAPSPEDSPESTSDSVESSSDPDDIEEEDENSEDEDDENSEDEESTISVKEKPVKGKLQLTHIIPKSKKKRPCTADGNATHDSHRFSAPLTSPYHFLACSNPAGLPQSAAHFLQSPRTTEEEEEGQQRISVIHATGLTASNRPSVQPHREACPLPFRSSSNPRSSSKSSKHFSTFTSSKHSSASCSPLALCSPNKGLHQSHMLKTSLLCSLKPYSLSLPKPPTLSASKKPSRESKFLTPSTSQPQPAVSLRKSSGNISDEHLLLDTQEKKQPLSYKEYLPTSFSLQPTSQRWDTNIFLNSNGLIHGTTQDVPLALISKPSVQRSSPNSDPVLGATTPPRPMPVNMTSGTKRASSFSFISPTSSHLAASLRKTKTIKDARNVKTNTSSPCRPVNLARSNESDIHNRKDSEDSLEDDCDDDSNEIHIEDEDSGSSLSDSGSNMESSSDGFAEDVTVETDIHSDAERKLGNPTEGSVFTQKSSLSFSTNCSPLNLCITKPPSLPNSLLAPTTSSGELSEQSTTSFTFTARAGKGARRSVTDEHVLQLPLNFGWQRETRFRNVAGRLQGEVAYFAPCGKRLRQYADVMKYLIRNGITEITRDNFSFSTKIQVGEFYEAREGPEGIQWLRLSENEIAPMIMAMDGRRSGRTKLEHQPMCDGMKATQWKSLSNGENNFQDVRDPKLLRKLEAREIARQAAEIKMMQKLKKQAMAQAAKEAKKQRAIIEAEERRKKREQLKILKQQEKIKHIQQIRMERELRAQRILEEKRKKKEEAAHARLLEAEKRKKEKEMQRMQAAILRQQELECHRLDMVWERERRRQHMMLMKAVEAQKKAEEKERLRKEKMDERRLKKEKKLELRRLELEKAKELKNPVEDMCLADHEPLPVLARVSGLVLPGSAITDCLIILQFVHSFGKVLGLDFSSDMLTISDLQEGLLNIGNSIWKVQDLLVSMVAAAVCDPGIPAGHKNKTVFGDQLTNVEINRGNVSEILQIYMDAHSKQAEVVALAFSLRTKVFQAHNPSQKASILAFLVNELCCSKAVISEIDKNIDYMGILRKDKWVVEGKLRKLRRILTKKRESNVGGEENHTFVISTIRNKCKRKEGDSEEEEDEEDGSDDQGDEEEEEEEEMGGKKGKKAEICEEDDGVDSASIEELEKQIEETCQLKNQIKQKLFESSQKLRSMMIGQDRYKRGYWVLPQCGGIFVEGVQNGEESEEEKRLTDAHMIGVEEHQMEETKAEVPRSPKTTDGGVSANQEYQSDKYNLFLQKSSSFSMLEKDIDVNIKSSLQTKASITLPFPPYPTLQTFTIQQGLMNESDTSQPTLLNGTKFENDHWKMSSPQPNLDQNQLSKILTDNTNQWFSLLPRSPCEESSVTPGSSPPASSSSLQPTSSFYPSPPTSIGCNSTIGISKSQSPVLQVKSGILQSRVTLSDTCSSATSPNLPSSGNSLLPGLDPASQHAEENGKKATEVNKSDKPPPAAEGARTQVFLCPQSIPKEMLHGWWMVPDTENLDQLVKALHSRGIREKALQKQIEKHMEHVAHLFVHSKHVVMELEKQLESKELVKGWHVEDHAMEADINLLRQVEALEKNIISASLQVKGWMYPKPQSDDTDLVYHEHKPSFSSIKENKSEKEAAQEELHDSIVRWPNNPLDIAITRLAELEKNIDRSEEEYAPGVRLWRKVLSQVRSSAQLSLCIQHLQKSIIWERVIMKVYCQLCEKGDNEQLLLLCDKCDRGYHTYCHTPEITMLPDGEWFCPTCESKEGGQSLQNRKQQSRTAGGGKKRTYIKQNIKPSVVGGFAGEEDASSVPKQGTKEVRKRSGDDGTQTTYDSSVSCVKKVKTFKDDMNGLALCRVLLAELEAHRDAWPFLSPVNHRATPGYKKIIKKPMDFSTIKEKLTSNRYLNLETFFIDVNLVFDNCKKFNEDDSEIGQAGHRMRRFFDKRWPELLQ
ncbi:bromodomain adjacent to zinc finger domain protein 2B [Pholidichthys leucotaenia]